jgi:bifunctional non-homologous end joining protein LigD
MIFDVLAVDGQSLTALSFARRRDSLEQLGLHGPAWMTPDTFDDGHARYDAVCDRGLRGHRREVAACQLSAGAARLDQGEDPAYWRRPSEMAAMSKRRGPVLPG